MFEAASDPPLVIVWYAGGSLLPHVESAVKKSCGSDYHAFHGDRPFISPFREDGYRCGRRLLRDARARKRRAYLLIVGDILVQGGALHTALIAKDAVRMGAHVTSIAPEPQHHALLREPHRRLRHALRWTYKAPLCMYDRPSPTRVAESLTTRFSHREDAQRLARL